MKVKLSKRLQAVADYVTKGSSLADIGTDHAYIPIYLFQQNIIAKAFALDINRGPVTRAEFNIASYGIGQYIETRVSDGMENLQPGEADSAVIAGMGGQLIVKILSAHPHITDKIKEFIIQPQSEIAFVRRYLRDHNFYISDESMVLEEGKYYTILYVVHGKTKRRETLEPVEEVMYDQYGEHLIKQKHPVFLSFLIDREEKLCKILRQLGTTANIRGQKRREEIEKELLTVNHLLQICACRPKPTDGCKNGGFL